MNIVRRIAAICFCLAVAAALPVGLAGCGPKSAAPSSGATDTTQPDTTQTETSTLLSTQALADIFPDLSRAQYSVYSLHGDLVYIASQSGTVSVVARGDSGGQIEETYANGEPDAGTAYVYGHVFSIVLSGKADGVPNRLVTIDDSLTLNERDLPAADHVYVSPAGVCVLSQSGSLYKEDGTSIFSDGNLDTTNAGAFRQYIVNGWLDETHFVYSVRGTAKWVRCGVYDLTSMTDLPLAGTEGYYPFAVQDGTVYLRSDDTSGSFRVLFGPSGNVVSFLSNPLPSGTYITFFPAVSPGGRLAVVADDYENQCMTLYLYNREGVQTGAQPLDASGAPASLFFVDESTLALFQQPDTLYFYTLS